MESSSKFKLLPVSGAGSMGISFFRSKIKPLVIEHCPFSAIVAAPPLQELIFERFKLVHFDKTNFSTFLVMEKDAYQDRLFWMSEDIFDVVEYDLKLKEEPYIGEVVLARHPNHKNNFHRAYVDEIHFADIRNPSTADSTALVYFIDLGGYFKVNLKDLKPVTVPIMEVPILSYRVKLYNDDFTAFNDQGLLICKEFQKFMEKVQKAELIVKQLRLRVVEDTSDSDSVSNSVELEHFYINPVTIEYVFEKTSPSPLATALNQLTIWEWERTLKSMLGSDSPRRRIEDDTISTNGQFAKVERDISDFQLTPGTTFTAEVTRIFESETEDDTDLNLRVILLNDDVYQHYHRVLHNQMDRYSESVRKSRYSPAIKDVFMFRLDKKKEYVRQGIKGLNTWCRAVKMDVNWIHLIDWDANLPLDGMDSNDYDMRLLYGEFLQVPALALTIKPAANGKIDVRIPIEKGKELFTVGQRYEFKVPKESSNNGMEGLVEFPGWSGEDEKPEVVEETKEQLERTWAPSGSGCTSSSSSDDDAGLLIRRYNSSTSTSTSSKSE